MLIQKRLFIWQTILVILFLVVIYIFGGIRGDVYLFDFINYLGLFVIFLLAIILFAPIEILYLTRLRNQGKLAELNKIFRIICYILLMPTLYHILLFLCVHAENFWWELFYKLFYIDVDRFFWSYRWMLHSFTYPVIYLLLALLLLEMILINKKMPKE